MSKPKLYIVEADMLPEVFLKVSEAKEFLQTGGILDPVNRFLGDAVFADVAFQPFPFETVLFRRIGGTAQPDGQSLGNCYKAAQQVQDG